MIDYGKQDRITGGRRVRITGGEFCGQRIKTPARMGRIVRPTQDKVREALFSCIGEKIRGCRFLDLFAGSGAVGLDARSRGARCVYWIESNPRALALLRENVERLYGTRPPASLHLPTSLREVPARNAAHSAAGGLRAGNEELGEVVRIVKGDAVKFLEKQSVDEPFDIIFADPPYDREGKHAWLRKALQALSTGSMLAEEGMFVAEQSVDEPVETRDQWVLTREKTYGGTRLCFFEK